MIVEKPVRAATAFVFFVRKRDMVRNGCHGVLTARRLSLDIDVAVVNLSPGRAGLLANFEIRTFG